MTAPASTEYPFAQADVQRGPPDVSYVLGGSSAQPSATDASVQHLPMGAEERATQDAIAAAARLAGVVLVIGGALFAVGFMWPHIVGAARRVAIKLQDAKIPLTLPVGIAESVQEVLAERRLMAEMARDERTAG
jgi:hypothetical protein